MPLQYRPSDGKLIYDATTDKLMANCCCGGTPYTGCNSCEQNGGGGIPEKLKATIYSAIGECWEHANGTYEIINPAYNLCEWNWAEGSPYNCWSIQVSWNSFYLNRWGAFIVFPKHYPPSACGNNGFAYFIGKDDPCDPTGIYTYDYCVAESGCDCDGIDGATFQIQYY